jgi:HK97 family phage major capsid protein
MNVTAKKLETRAMPTLLEQRNTLMDELETILSKAKTETRALDDKEQARFTEIKETVQNIDKTMTAEQQAEQLKQQELSQKKSPEQEEQRALAEDKFLRFIRGEERALDVAGNGAIIPTEISSRIITRVRELSSNLYQRCTIFNVGGDLVFPCLRFKFYRNELCF